MITIMTIIPISFILMISFCAHTVVLGDFKYYQEIYKKFERGLYEYDDSMSGESLYFNHQSLNPYHREEIIFFKSGGIKLCNGVYIHNHFVTYLVPYSFYYMHKFNKLKNKIMREKSEESFQNQISLYTGISPNHFVNMSTSGWDIPTQPKKTKKDFKFFR